MATETNWDGGSTTWDRDHAGPGTRTIWDLLPDELKIDQLAKVLPAAWMATTRPAAWVARTVAAKWKAKVKPR